MGQTLSEPVTEKESAHCQNDELAVSIYQMNRLCDLFGVRLCAVCGF